MSEKMPESPEIHEGFDQLRDAALDAGLHAKLPEKGTAAWLRVYEAAKKYSDAVHSYMNGKVFEDPAIVKDRREYHDQLFRILFGTDYDHTKSYDITAAANFAHLVAGRDQYVE